MVKSIESYISETTKSYQPATNALNKQLSGLSGQTANTISDIENQFANQRSQLLNQANQAAEAASLTAAGNGGSFGGAANEANRKYYERSFIPAMTSANTNRSSAISQARANEASQRASLEQQLANLYTQANTYGTQRYDQAVAAEAAQKQFEAQQALERERLAEQQRQYNLNLELEKQKLAESKRQAQASLAAQNSWQTYLNQASQTPKYKSWDFGNGYSIIDNNGQAVYARNGQRISAGDFLTGAITQGGHHQYDKWNDIWNSGVSTSGIGADTVSLFRKANVNPDSSAYGYLWR